MNLHWLRGRWTLVIEAGFALLIVYSVWWNLKFLFTVGHLPPPYYRGLSDTLMDWFNVAFYAHNPGAYSAYLSVYPPIAFDFLRVTGLHSCYRFDSFFARDCDWLSKIWMILVWIIAGVVSFLIYRARDRRTALIRCIATVLGLPMLYALERGNLVIVTFVFFALGHGRLLKSAWMRWVGVAVAINFKPYLVLSVAPQLLKGRWRWLEGAAVATLVVYMISYALKGVGTPAEILTNTFAFTDVPVSYLFDWATYGATYELLIQLLKSQFPMMTFMGSSPMEFMEVLFPTMIHLGQLGVVAVFLGTLWRPGAVPTHRLAALSVAVVTTTINTGGYSQLFLLFLVFLEPWKGRGCILALIFAYLLSISVDLPLFNIAHEEENSWLTGRYVGVDLSVEFGEILRPAMVLFIQYGLCATSIADLWRARAATPKSSHSSRPELAPTLSS